MFLRMLNGDTKITNLLKILLRETYLEAGTRSLFANTQLSTRRILSYLTPTWITCLLEFLTTYSITCNIDEGGMALPLQRTHDQYLMDVFPARRPNYTIKQLRSLNRVRLHLQVYSLACVSHPLNHLVDRRIMTRTTSWAARRSTLIWPKVTLKGHDWKIWKLMMEETFPQTPTTRKHKFGPWICTHQLWPLWQHPPPNLSSYWTESTGRSTIISIMGQAIDPSLLHGALYRHVQGPPLHEYIRFRTSWGQEQFDQVNWIALQGALHTSYA